MKKIAVITAAVFMAVSLGACGGKKETASAESTAGIAETTVTAAATVPETVPETTADADIEEVKTVTGEIIDAAMNTIIIRTEDGTDLILGKEDAETDLKDGLLIGNSVVVEYTGEIVGNNASAAKVLKIFDYTP